MLLLEQRRLQVSKKTDAIKKSQLGQFFTPASTARFMAGLFPDSHDACRLLDAGAGIGSLVDAFLRRWRAGGLHFSRVDVDAFEVDVSLHGFLNATLETYQNQPECVANVRSDDFIHAAVAAISGDLFATTSSGYTHAILNPP